jgi:hypothetical protein
LRNPAGPLVLALLIVLAIAALLLFDELGVPAVP